MTRPIDAMIQMLAGSRDFGDFYGVEWSKESKAKPQSGVTFLSGCGAAYPGAPTFYNSDDADETGRNFGTGGTPMRVQVGNYHLVDNGDGVYRTNDPRDHFENAAGVTVSAKDPALEAYLNSIGLDSKAMDGVRVKELGEYIAVLGPKLMEIKNASDENAVRESYKELSEAANKAGVTFDLGSPLYNRVMATTGSMGCYIPLYLAESHARYGRLDPMNSALTSAQMCASSKSLADQDFPGMISQTKLDGYLSALKSVANSDARYGRIDDMNKTIAVIEASAEKNGILDTIKSKIQETRLIGFNSAIRSVADSDARYGRVADMNKTLNEISAEAKRVNFLPQVADNIRKTRIAGYLSAIKSISDSDARYGRIDDMNKTLASIETTARAHNVFKAIWNDFYAARLRGYRSAIQNVADSDARYGRVNDMNAVLSHIVKTATDVGIISAISKEVLSVRVAGYNSAIESISRSDARYGRLNDMNAALDDYVRTSKQTGAITHIQGNLYKVRVAGYKSAIKSIARSDARYGRIADMEKALGEIEKTAKAYNIYDAIKDDIEATKKIGYKNARKK
jgi:hypothetical protein